jgi:hypothetical protein
LAALVAAGNTLDTYSRGAGFSLAANWPGLALITLGAIAGRNCILTFVQR